MRWNSSQFRNCENVTCVGDSNTRFQSAALVSFCSRMPVVSVQRGRKCQSDCPKPAIEFDVSS